MKIIKNLSKKRLTIEANKIAKAMMDDIIDRMEQEKITVDELCKELSISESKFYGKTPTLEQLIRICYSLKIDPVDLFKKYYHEHIVIY